MQWCANNWRMAQKNALKGNNWAPKRTEVIARKDKEAVKAEMDRLREENPGKPLLALRQMALSNILNNLSHAEGLALDAEVKRIQRDGNSDEDKQR